MQGVTFTIQTFDPQAATPAQRLSVGGLLADCYSYAYPDDPPMLPQRQADLLLHTDPDEQVLHLVAWQNEQAVGYATLGLPLTDNLHLGYINALVHPNYRRQGLGWMLSQELLRLARQQGRTSLIIHTTSRVPDGEGLARKLGAAPALPNRQSRLMLADLDPALLQAWTQRPSGEPYRLHRWLNAVPEEYLPRFADLFMVMNTAPKGDLDVEDWLLTPESVRAKEQRVILNGESLLMCVVEDTRTGVLVGLTEVFWGPERAELVYQGATVVRPEARGHGLGKWLKADMLRWLSEFAPQARYISTNNAQENAAMLGINVALGFKPYATVTEWQLGL